MQHDRYVCTLSYKFCPAFPIAAADLREFAIKQRPTLRGTQFQIQFHEIPRNFNGIQRNSTEFNETSTKLQRKVNGFPRKVNGYIL